MAPYRPTTRGRHLRRGSAMVEFALALPLLVLVMSILLFFGWQIPRRHNAIVGARHSVWRTFDGGTPSDAELDGEFLEDRATWIGQSHAGGPLDSYEAWAGATDPDARDLAEELVTSRWPHGRQTRLSAEWITRVRLWQELSDPDGDPATRGHVSGRHAREGIEWHHGQVAPWATLRDLYAEELHDDALGTVPAPGDGLARTIQGLLVAHW